ncbi:serine hydrolase domain-containing protein [Umezawaea sp. Da 62-37]|uniref:serine hydrolase domain-containing protein n=1 Tax=Umezawaea sp. Da 62-37 TaxID=3075927 RepID=UPI0028F71B92|nr:serine hydrolase domain-containing protein [Umezawaea sp. Da 62-37]WNV87927.1 serine hydrolase domain-containing protein [Umezawaea sp. Da 62-37]
MAIRLDLELSALLDELLTDFAVPGAAAQVVSRNRVRKAVAGVESTASAFPVGPHSRFGIGSISKIPTIAVALSLMDERGIGLDTPLAHLLPDLEFAEPGLAARITVRHVVTHSSGLQSDHFPDLPPGDDLLTRYVASCRTVGALHDPGERFSYCNSGFILLGAVAERLGGRPWPELLTQRVLVPLGMADTVLGAGGDTDEPVRGHVVDPATGVLVEEPFWLPAPVGPAGLLSTTTEDLTRFLGAVLPGRPGRFARAAAVMAGPGIATPPGHSLLGARRWLPGWAEWDLDGLRVLGYDGCIGNQCSAVRIVPDEDFTAVVLTNALEGEWVAAELLDHVLAEAFDVRVPALPEPAPAGGPLPRTAVYTRDGATLVLEHDGPDPVLSLRFGGDIAPWTAMEFHRAPLRPAGDRLWVVDLDRGSREVAFDGPLVGGAPEWLHFEVQAHRLAR